MRVVRWAAAVFLFMFLLVELASLAVVLYAVYIGASFHPQGGAVGLLGNLTVTALAFLGLLALTLSTGDNDVRHGTARRPA